MHLHDYLDQYNRSHEIQPATLEHYRWVIRSFEHRSGPIMLADLNADLVNGWLLWLRDNGRSPWTIKQRKISLLVLWRSAWFDGLAPAIPPIRRLKPLHHAPTAWTLAEVRQLLAAAEADRHRPAFWSSLIRAGYDSGLRLGDLLALCVHQVAPLCTIVQHKTGSPVAIQFRPETLQAIRRQIVGLAAGDAVWPLWGRREAFYRAFRRLICQAAIRPGTFRWLRRTAATQLEREQPGRGTELLGHASRSTTETWYLDRAQLAAPPLPPF
jgi:integrase